MKTRIASKMAISQMDNEDLEISLNDFIERVALITGIPMPSSEKFLEILVEELIILLKLPKFNNLCTDELLLAARMSVEGGVRFTNGDYMERVDLFGANISIDYISQILTQYLTLRNGLDAMIKNIVDGY